MFPYRQLTALISSVLFFSLGFAQTGKIGINTSSPQAMLHVKDSSVIFTGATNLPVTPGNPPVSGQGVRMMWYPEKAAFRVGWAGSTSWDKDSIGKYSFASGEEPKAKGFNSIAMGQRAEAIGSSSVSLGAEAIAFASGSIAIGVNAYAGGQSSTAIGFGTDALGEHSTALGYSTEAIGRISTTMGYESNGIGEYSTAMGYIASAIGQTSVAIGHVAKATGTYAASIGYRTVVRAYASTAIGHCNDSISTSNPNVWIDADPIFIVGNGVDQDNRHNAITVLKNAKTGINMSDPMAGLDIKGLDGTINRHIRLESTSSSSSANIYYSGDLFFRNNSSGGDFYFEDHTGANILSLFSSGNMTIAGTLTQNSDARVKEKYTSSSKQFAKNTFTQRVSL